MGAERSIRSALFWERKITRQQFIVFQAFSPEPFQRKKLDFYRQFCSGKMLDKRKIHFTFQEGGRNTQTFFLEYMTVI